jgi:hypothetical protein
MSDLAVVAVAGRIGSTCTGALVERICRHQAGRRRQGFVMSALTCFALSTRA